MAKQLRWGILGTGNIAKQFTRALPNSRTGRAVAVGSRSQGSADAFGEQFGVARRHASYEALLADPEVDAVYISTPHPLHAQWAIAAAEAGKHILCEKPLAMHFGEAAAVVDAAERHDVFLMEAFMYRCHPQTAKLVKLIQEGAIGEVQLIEATFAFRAGMDLDRRTLNHTLGGGGILDIGCYPVSMARLLAGVARGKPFENPTSVTGAGVIGSESRVDEWAVACLRFPGNVLAQLTTGVRFSGRNTVRVHGTEGWIEVPEPWVVSRDGGRSTIHVHPSNGKPKRLSVQSRRPLYAIEADTVAKHIKDREAPHISRDDTLGNMQVLDQWRQAIGLVYDQEQPERLTTPVRGRPLEPGRLKPRIPSETIPGMRTALSRLLMGVDNQRDLRSASVLFDTFFEHGGNAFDTAYVYGAGSSEKLLGQWIKNRGLRDEVVILDKGAHTPECYPDAVERQLAISLERLQVDFVDVYMLHRDNPEIPVGEFVDALYEAHRAGRIGIYGGSNWSLARVAEANRYAAEKGIPGFRAVSNQFSLARMIEPMWGGCISTSDPESRAWFERTGLALMPWSSQARGFFTDRSGPDKRNDEELVRCWYASDNFERKARAEEIARRKGVEPINIALAYVLNQPFPTFPLIGPRSLRELRSSLTGLGVTLTDEEQAWLNLEDSGNPTEP